MANMIEDIVRGKLEKKTIDDDGYGRYDDYFYKTLKSKAKAIADKIRVEIK